MAKKAVNLSLDDATKERLERYARKHHISSISQAVTQWIWSVNDKDLDKDLMPGQMNLDEYLKPSKKKKPED
jgi:hypothetical protein